MDRDSRPCLVVLLCAIPLSSGDDMASCKSLLKFKESLTNATMLSDWKESVANMCSNPVWNGCVCTAGVLTGLRLEGMGLGGRIDKESLSNLPLFYSLSVMNNSFSGPFPSDLNKLRNLRSLYLADNKFNGEILDKAFSGMKGMRRVVLGNNEFTGNIPMSLLQLLVDLQLQNNLFDGDLWQENLTINLSYNKLEGSIPTTLRSHNASSFYGPSADLATWVNSVVREDWTSEVFDKDMNLARRGEGQTFRLLKIGMCCCEWDLKEAIEKTEESEEKDSNDHFSSYTSDVDAYSPRAMTDDAFSFSKA